MITLKDVIKKELIYIYNFDYLHIIVEKNKSFYNIYTIEEVKILNFQ